MDYTPNSGQLVRNLLNGKYNIAVAGIDNVIAYQEGQVKEPVVNPDMFAFYGVDNGLLSLVANPQIKNISDLKGKQVSVDALTTGYAFVIRNYLEKNGLTQNDVHYTSVGSTNDRFNALLAGKTDATLLRTPLNLQAKKMGLRSLPPEVNLATIRAQLAYNPLLGGSEW
ncbi:putative periplasmic protein [Yersinia pestis]|uniref:Periplasmic protein n=1 Tax=Yersinia pestis TaxID=632 RepID=A0AAX2I6K7_YERPE|nr:putative periplasmic protein [Yersinia pestis]